MQSRKLADVPDDLGDFSKEEMNVDWLKDKAKYDFINPHYLLIIVSPL
jgi:hypothetical protein